MNPKGRFFSSLIVVMCLYAGLRTASAEVKVWEGTFKLPVYEEGSPNPNPPFDQYSHLTNYPYTLRDSLTGQRVDHDLRAVFLENEYLKCTILPDLGGHIYTCIDKLSKQPMFYANPSIKKAEIGYRGSWGGVWAGIQLPEYPHNWVSHFPLLIFPMPRTRTAALPSLLRTSTACMEWNGTSRWCFVPLQQFWN